jgi:hypothetical protein
MFVRCDVPSPPAGRRLRQSLIRPLEADIAREARRWWTEP